MNCHIRRLEVATTIVAVCLLLLWTPVVHAQAGSPGTLIGEDMIATGFRASGQPNCDYYGVFYTVFGPATGPYSGTFYESGVFYASWTPGDTRYDAYFQGTFHIDSAFGTVDGSGEANIPASQLTCYRLNDANGNPISRHYIGHFGITYTASIAAFPSCQLQVQADVHFELVMAPDGRTVISSYFEQYVYNSQPVACPGAIGPPARVTLYPLNAVNPVGTSHTVIATVTDFIGNPVPNTTVDFTVTGADNLPGSCTTDQNGQCSFTYQGPPLPGADAIRGCVNSVTPSVCGDAAKEWVLPASTPGQVTGGGQIMMPPTDKVSFGFNAQSDGTTAKGNCNVIDHDKRIHIKCDNVQALVVAGTHATFFGQADQDGVTTNYRIDVDDLADSGAGMDTFKIQTDQGYVAGGFLTAGNIKIHK
jgi:Bacterial Ig-like domain (group 1)